MKKGSQDWPLVSCIIYTFNRADVLPRAIRSVLAQTNKNFELIISDDCSSDNTMDVAFSFEDKRIVYHCNEKNLGSSANKNQGIKLARGRFIIILDDTKAFMPTLFQEALDLLDGSLPCVGGIRVGRLIHQPGYTDYAPPITHTGFDSIDWGFMLKREVFETCRYDENCCGDEDADFGIQFAQRWQTLPIDKPLTVAYATYQDSNSAPTERRLKGLAYFMGKNLAIYRQHPNELRYLYRLAGRNFYKGGYRLTGIRYFWLSFMAKKNIRTFLHFFFILFGWKIYDSYMDWYERRNAQRHLHGQS